jgi:hypothetical protein
VYGEVPLGLTGLAAVHGYNDGNALFGVYGDGGSNGSGVFGRGFGGAAVSGLNTGPGAAGYFIGDVVITGNITIMGDIVHAGLADDLLAIFRELDGCCGFSPGGNFLIDHPIDPANKVLSHAAVKSPDVKNIYDGVATLDANGEATVQLPSWFTALNSDVRYQLTPIGGPAPNLHIASKIADNSFKIAGGSNGMEICWQVTGIRHDPWITAHPFVVEQAKAATERGYYVHPEVYNQTQDKDIRWVQKPEEMRRLKELQNEPDATLRLIQQRRDAALEERLKQPRPARPA